MSFTSKNLHQTRGGMGFIKWATLFFLGMSCVLFLTKAFDITPVANNFQAYFKKVILTPNGTNNSSTAISLDGDLGDAYFGGKVGINNTTPSYDLDVNGTARATTVIGTTVMGDSVCVNGDCKSAWPSGGTAAVPWGSIGNIQFNDGSDFSWTNNLFRDNANGRLGIKTVAPTSTLDVNGSASVNGRIVVNSNNVYLSGTSIGIGFCNPAWWLACLLRPLIMEQGSDLYILNGGGNIIMNATGGVGIGTTSPTAKLEIEWFSTNPMLDVWDASRYVRIYNDGSDYAWIQWNSFGIGRQIKGSDDYSIPSLNVQTNNTADLVLWTNNNERIRIKSNGNIGIGTDSPWGTFDMKSGSGRIISSIGTWLWSTIIGSTYSYESHNGFTLWFAYFSPVGITFLESKYPLNISAGWSLFDQGIWISTWDNVGIGTSTPSYKLDVSGEARITDPVYLESRVWIWVNPVSTDEMLEVNWGIKLHQYSPAINDWDGCNWQDWTLAYSNGHLYFCNYGPVMAPSYTWRWQIL